MYGHCKHLTCMTVVEVSMKRCSHMIIIIDCNISILFHLSTKQRKAITQPQSHPIPKLDMGWD